MSTSNPKPDPSLDEQLVAYLDGELSHEESELVERRLQGDEHFRSQLQKFDRVWNALDELPQTSVGESFTRTTIEMVAVEAQKDLTEQTALFPVRQRNRHLKSIALGAAGLVAGFLLLWLVVPNPNRALLGNLAVIEQIDAYNEIDDIDFLRKLRQSSGDWLLSGEWQDEVESQASLMDKVDEADYYDRYAMVEEMQDEHRTELAAKAKRYERLSPEARDTLLKKNQSLQSSDDTEELRKVMLAYYAWLGQFSEADQARLRNMMVDERIKKINEMQRQHRRREGSLSATNKIRLRETMKKMRTDPEILALHNALVKKLESWNGPLSSKIAKRFSHLERAKNSPEQMMRFILFADGNVVPEVSAYREKVEERLISAVDESAQKVLRDKPSEAERAKQLNRWLWESSKLERPDAESLKELLESDLIEEEEKYRLLSLPLDEMNSELEKLYFREFFGGRGPWRGGFDRGPRGPRGPDDRERRGPNDRGGRRRGPGGDRPDRGGPPPPRPEDGPPGPPPA